MCECSRVSVAHGEGKLKRQYNHHISIKDVLLDRQRLTDLDRCHEAVLENITAYDLIQDRIKELDTKKPSRTRRARYWNSAATTARLLNPIKPLSTRLRLGFWESISKTRPETSQAQRTWSECTPTSPMNTLSRSTRSSDKASRRCRTLPS